MTKKACTCRENHVQIVIFGTSLTYGRRYKNHVQGVKKISYTCFENHVHSVLFGKILGCLRRFSF